MSRGCGTQDYDSNYMFWPLGHKGIPVRMTTLCPIWRLDQDKLGIKDRGVTKLPQRNFKGEIIKDPNDNVIYDLYDVVGRKFYKYKTDFFHEACAKGISRKVVGVDFSGIDPLRSRYYLCTHAAAVSIEDAERLRKMVNHLKWGVYDPHCFKEIHDHKVPFHDKFYETCTAMWHYELPYSAFKDDDWSVSIGSSHSLYFRDVADVTYRALPVSNDEPVYEFGAFMALQAGIVISTLPKGETEMSPTTKKVFDDAMANGLQAATWDLSQGGF